jgi:hypothetical protein
MGRLATNAPEFQPDHKVDCPTDLSRYQAVIVFSMVPSDGQNISLSISKGQIRPATHALCFTCVSACFTQSSLIIDLYAEFVFVQRSVCRFSFRREFFWSEPGLCQLRDRCTCKYTFQEPSIQCHD